jgi:primosomal protein N' (replication factor Y)
LRKIHNEFKTKNVCVLHGVTASGKTEIYINLIQELLAENKQVLYLLPEIALTSQIINRLRNAFGNKVGIYHSQLNDNERIELWNDLLDDSNRQFQVILGVRSSIFLPFRNLGAVIIDEEHEQSFKQFDPAPRYHARDTAIVLASIHNAKVLLGTATPSAETYFNILQKKYGLVELTKRHDSFSFPEIAIIDLKKAYKRKQMNKHFSKELLTLMQKNLNEQRQILLFQNRRGYSPFITCTDCGHIPHCKNCDVSMTYHKETHQLVCHYCGYSIQHTSQCTVCGSNQTVLKGFGTEKIEEELQELFPTHSIARMDLDTTRKKNGHSTIIHAFENRETDILIGTQMVTKGLDFDNIGLVGILIQDILSNNPKRFIIKELHQRKAFNYPPFTRLVRIHIKHTNKEITESAAQFCAQLLSEQDYVQILGPEFPPIQKIQKMYAMHILLKIHKSIPYKDIRKKLHSIGETIKKHPEYKKATIQFDVDPY